MKLRDPRVIAAAGWCGTRLVKLLSSTLQFDHRSLGPTRTDPFQSPESDPLIFALWHENFLIPIVRFGHPGIACLVSRHADGQLLGTLIRSTGMSIIHGSTNRGGVAAVRQLLRHKDTARHLAVTPDGPRGPRRHVQPGVVYLASRTGMRIVPVGVGHRRPWRVKSWDAFAIPRPFSRVRCLFGGRMVVPPQLSTDGLTPYVERLQHELDRLTMLAQLWADTDQLIIPTPPSSVPVVQQLPPSVQVVAGATRESGE
jgi:lysophospholipid acyltransferase (LPLAT)-like uncharacterized protein